MDKKTIIINIVVLAVMSVGIAIAVYFLYHNVASPTDELSAEQLEYDLDFPGAGVSGDPSSIKVSEKEAENLVDSKEKSKVQIQVPQGPFEVRNSKTGRTNLFCQNDDKSLILKDKGKALWINAFHTPICGRVGQLDYYANGKLQYAFCAGSKIYVIDRLGRYVKTFPKDLHKEVLLGPDIYDFNGQHIYNFLVLHKDNTIDMYNMKGQKPASWKGITSAEQILDLPQRIEVGGKTFWVVSTSIQKCIFPFYGGKALNTGSQIPSSAQIKVINSTSIQFTNADGQKQTVRLR